jgi:Spy/CpxP family protein refolding chaperone
MMKNFKQTLLAVVLTSCCGVSAIALAQTAPDAPPRPQHPMGEPGKNPEQMKERFAKHQAELHDTLKITAAQEPAWKTFIQSVTPKAMPQREDFKELDKLTTPQRMEKMLEKMKEHQAALQDRLAATKTFYATLTPEQQKIFDESHRRLQHKMQSHMARQMHKRGDAPGMMDKP